MCVGLSARVEEVENGSARINCMGARRQVSVDLLPNIRPGDYVMIHAGVAIARITAEEAEESRAVMEELYGER